MSNTFLQARIDSQNDEIIILSDGHNRIVVTEAQINALKTFLSVSTHGDSTVLDAFGDERKPPYTK